MELFAMLPLVKADQMTLEVALVPYLSNPGFEDGLGGEYMLA